MRKYCSVKIVYLLDVQYPNTREVYTRNIQNVPEITSHQRFTNQYNYLRYISFKIVPLLKNTLLSPIVRKLEAFLGAIS